MHRSLHIVHFFCGISAVCGFDSSDCGFISSVTHKGRWVRTKAVKNEVDHTYGTENGESQYNWRGHNTI